MIKILLCDSITKQNIIEDLEKLGIIASIGSYEDEPNKIHLIFPNQEDENLFRLASSNYAKSLKIKEKKTPEEVLAMLRARKLAMKQSVPKRMTIKQMREYSLKKKAIEDEIQNLPMV